MNKINKNINNKQTTILVILDGFGIRKDEYYNGILNAHMKNYFNLYNSYPHTHLHASGPLVGLPEGQIGSSEVGHMTLGAGKLIKQPIVRINEEIENNNFYKNKKLIEGLNYAIKNNSNIHILGLLGPGGVHSLDTHLYAFLNFYDQNANKIKGKIFIHNFLDGRDVAQKSALKFLNELNEKINTLEHKEKFIISTLCGRYYAMDRDQRWERIEKAYDLLVNQKGEKIESYKKAIEKSYKNKITDEFFEPTILNLEPIKNNDLVIFYNFRSDRPKELTQSIIDKKFNKFNTKKLDLKFQTLTQYSINFQTDVLYPTIYPKNTLGEILSKNNKTQLRIAESEKFPHVTYFFSGLKYEKFKNEDQIKISSPNVATYDLKPEMSAPEVTRRVLKEINSQKYDFILLNYANSDMVGHTGDYKAVIKAMHEIDKDIKLIKNQIDKINGTLMITADHGNCEEMRDENNNPHTKHTYNQVPFILCDKKYQLRKDYNNLALHNIAPTILEIMKIKKYKEQSESLIIKK